MNLNDTIAAVSTPRGKGGVAMIRISGRDALNIASVVFRPVSKKSFADTTPRLSVYGDIVGKDGSRIDDGLAVYYRSPYSFTGEDTVELCCHGGALVTQTVLEAVLIAGARQAEAGEFTRRAFVNGKMDLSRAEALSLLLEAKTDEQLRLSRSGLDGRFSEKAHEIYSRLRRVVSDIYAKVDFPDEDLSGMSRDDMIDEIEDIKNTIYKTAATYKVGRAICEGIKTVICGRTNSGKSSLYNALVGSEAAIVTDIEGTTRDLLEETVSFGGVTLRLCDTAGLRESGDKVEQIGIERAREKIDQAELIFVLYDSTRERDEEELRLAEILSEKTDALVIPILTKSDMEKLSDIPEKMKKLSPISLSVVDGNGMAELSARVRSAFLDGDIDIRRDAVAINARQYAALTRAGELVDSSLNAVKSGLPEDIFSSDLECAMGVIGEIDGNEVSSDVVSEIFSHFCVGK